MQGVVLLVIEQAEIQCPQSSCERDVGRYSPEGSSKTWLLSQQVQKEWVKVLEEHRASSSEHWDKAEGLLGGFPHSWEDVGSVAKSPCGHMLHPTALPLRPSCVFACRHLEINELPRGSAPSSKLYVKLSENGNTFMIKMKELLSNRAVFPYSIGNLAAAVHGSKGKEQEGNHGPQQQELNGLEKFFPFV